MLFNLKIKTISAQDAKLMLKKGSDAVLLDVRTPEEYFEKHISGSINIPLANIMDVKLEFPERDSAILLYCQTGARAAAAARSLVRMGYTNVYNLGGITDWPYDMVNNKA